MAQLESRFGIGEKVEFVPMFRHSQNMGIEQEEMSGEVIAIRFTKSKVFYDILDDYYAKVFDNVESSKVFVIEQIALKED